MIISIQEWNQLQIDEIHIHKWIESEKAGYDLGEDAIMDWCCRYAEKFCESQHQKGVFHEGETH